MQACRGHPLATTKSPIGTSNTHDYPGGWEGSPTGLASWPPDRGYAAEGWWQTSGVGVRGRVGATHRMLSTYLNAVLRAGFDFDEFMEPRLHVPVYFVARCHRRS